MLERTGRGVVRQGRIVVGLLPLLPATPPLAALGEGLLGPPQEAQRGAPAPDDPAEPPAAPLEAGRREADGLDAEGELRAEHDLEPREVAFEPAREPPAEEEAPGEREEEEGGGEREGEGQEEPVEAPEEDAHGCGLDLCGRGGRGGRFSWGWGDGDQPQQQQPRIASRTPMVPIKLMTPSSLAC